MGIPAIVIAGTNSGCGKTTVSIGVMAALVEKGFRVQPYKVGPDYIDPMFHTFVTGRESRNLDSWILNSDTVKYLYNKNAEGADIAVIEGVMGLYDGYGGRSLEGSTADIAGIIGASVILVIDGRAMSLSAAALVKGYADFNGKVNVKGVIINNIAREEHYMLLKEAIENYTGIKVLGYLERSDSTAIGSRHLGLITSCEISGMKEKAAILSSRLQKTIDLELLIKLAGGSGTAPGPAAVSGEDTDRIYDCNLANLCRNKNEMEPGTKPTRIAIARDKAFCFYYRDNLDLLERMGAELVRFSPLSDTSLPEGIDGLYLGGGYPEVWAEELQENTSIKQDIRDRITQGLPAYAECGGLMYLSDSIRLPEGSEFKMTGLIPGKSIMTSSLNRFGYVSVKLARDTILSKMASEIRAHEFHYSETIVDQSVKACFEVSKRRDGHVVKSWRCGYQVYNLLAGYPHMHFYSNPAFAKGFLDSCRRART